MTDPNNSKTTTIALPISNNYHLIKEIGQALLEGNRNGYIEWKGNKRYVKKGKWHEINLAAVHWGNVSRIIYLISLDHRSPSFSRTRKVDI